VPRLNPDDVAKEYGSEWSWGQDDDSVVIRILRLEGAVRGSECANGGGQRWWDLIEVSSTIIIPPACRQRIDNRISTIGTMAGEFAKTDPITASHLETNNHRHYALTPSNSLPPHVLL
jgi:hypothetical protein